MTRLLISVDGGFVREVVLDRQETTIGRKPHNDIVIDHLAVSSQHAVLRSDQGELWIEDLKSTNGTYVNGQAVSRRRLSHRDVIELGKVRLEVRLHDVVDDIEVRPRGLDTDEGLVRHGQEPAAGVDPDDSGADLRGGVAQIRVLNGAAAGREVLLTRERTTIGKPGVLVVAIERVGGSHLISQVEGMRTPNVNGRAIGSLGLALIDGDVIELAGTQIAFIAP
jgi:pSer/pThr/pTyr-binding forkhead associated (FHA) protein